MRKTRRQAHKQDHNTAQTENTGHHDVSGALRCGGPHGVEAQTATTKVPLFTTQVELARLAPDVTTADTVFVLDQFDSVVIDIVSTVGNLTTSVVGPGGEVLDPGTVGFFDGEFVNIAGTPHMTLAGR